jgi:flagellar biosynthesis component FlhA
LLLVVVFVAFTRGIPTSPFLHLAGGRGRPALPRKESKRKEEEKAAVVVVEREKEKEKEQELRWVEAELSGSDSASFFSSSR